MLTLNRLLVIVVLAVVAFGVWRFALPAGDTAADAVGDGAVAILDTRADARFTVAEVNLQAQLQATGSYAGAAMPAGAILARADGTGYCVQVGPPGTVSHRTGPGGVTAGGPC